MAHLGQPDPRVATEDGSEIGDPLEQSVVQALVAFRWLALTWMIVVVIVSREDLAHPVWAIGLILLTVGVTVAHTVAAGRNDLDAVRRLVLFAEIPVGVALVGLDETLYTVDQSNSFGSVWPVAGVLAAGALYGRRAGALAGLTIGAARLVSDLTGPGIGGRWLSLVSTTVVYVMAGWAAGELYRRLAEAQRLISLVRARDEIARTLHDGVLQTLAVIQRRSSDDQLVDLARRQEHELREYLFGTAPEPADLGAALHRAARRATDLHGIRVDVVLADDISTLGSEERRSIAGAVGECLTNAAKHGGAERVTVYAEPADGKGVFCSIKDDGRGFDPAVTSEGSGLARSVRGRIEEIGGRVEVDGRPGRGTEVRLWLGSEPTPGTGPEIGFAGGDDR